MTRSASDCLSASTKVKLHTGAGTDVAGCLSGRISLAPALHAQTAAPRLEASNGAASVMRHKPQRKSAAKYYALNFY